MKPPCLRLVSGKYSWTEFVDSNTYSKRHLEFKLMFTINADSKVPKLGANPLSRKSWIYFSTWADFIPNKGHGVGHLQQWQWQAEKKSVPQRPGNP